MTSKTASPAHEIVGHRFTRWKSSWLGERQRRYHEAASVDPTLFGDSLDISLLGNDCLKGARSPDNLGNPRLHYGVRVRQREAVRLGSLLDVAASVKAVDPVSRGRLIRIGFGFLLPVANEPAVEVEHQSLILDPEPGETEPTPATDWGWTGAEPIREMAMSLTAVSSYSWEFPYLEVHHFQEAAERIGMRVPIAQGLMGFSLLMAEIVRGLGRVPIDCDIEVQFRRPIFCDEILQLVGFQRLDGTWERLAVLNPAGKPTTQVQVHAAA